MTFNNANQSLLSFQFPKHLLWLPVPDPKVSPSPNLLCQHWLQWQEENNGGVRDSYNIHRSDFPFTQGSRLAIIHDRRYRSHLSLDDLQMPCMPPLSPLLLQV